MTTDLRLLGHYGATGYSLWTTGLWNRSSLKNTCQGLFILQGNFHTLRVLLVGKYEIRHFKRTGWLGGDLLLCIWARSADDVERVCCASLLLNLESGKPVLS